MKDSISPVRPISGVVFRKLESSQAASTVGHDTDLAVCCGRCDVGDYAAFQLKTGRPTAKDAQPQ